MFAKQNLISIYINHKFEIEICKIHLDKNYIIKFLIFAFNRYQVKNFDMILLYLVHFKLKFSNFLIYMGVTSSINILLQCYRSYFRWMETKIALLPWLFKICKLIMTVQFHFLNEINSFLDLLKFTIWKIIEQIIIT